MLIVDTGVVLAAADRSDPDHAACAHLLSDEPGEIVTTPLVVAEVGYVIARQLGANAEADFFRLVAQGEVLMQAITHADLLRIAELVDTYVDLPLGGTDASVVALAERLGETRVATLDHRHFSVVQVALGCRVGLKPQRRATVDVGGVST